MWNFCNLKNKIYLKIYVGLLNGASNWAHTLLYPRISPYFFFLNKVFKNITDGKINMMTAVYFNIYSLLLSQFSFLHLILYSYFALSWVASELFSFLPCIQQGKLLFPSNRRHYFTRQMSRFCSYLSPSLLSRSELATK